MLLRRLMIRSPVIMNQSWVEFMVRVVVVVVVVKETMLRAVKESAVTFWSHQRDKRRDLSFRAGQLVSSVSVCASGVSCDGVLVNRSWQPGLSLVVWLRFRFACGALRTVGSISKRQTVVVVCVCVCLCITMRPALSAETATVKRARQRRNSTAFTLLHFETNNRSE